MNARGGPDSGADAGTRPGFARHAESLHLRGATADALRLLTAGVRRNPGDVTARLVLARVCRDSGRAGEARDWLESVLRADPECPAALNQLSELLESRDGAAHREKLAAQEPWDEEFVAAHVVLGSPVKTVVSTAPPGPGAAPPLAPSVTPSQTHSVLETGLVPQPREARKELPPSSFVFPVREEEEEPEIEENSAPHVATVTLAEIYLQQGLKEQAAQIYRQLLERQPGDDSVRRRLQEIEGY
jgi:tetratricopeptide (TPR) repeat protein